MAQFNKVKPYALFPFLYTSLHGFSISLSETSKLTTVLMFEQGFRSEWQKVPNENEETTSKSKPSWVMRSTIVLTIMLSVCSVLVQVLGA